MPDAQLPAAALPTAAAARVHVIHPGYVREADGREHVGGTVTLIIDGDSVIVVDPGMVASRDGLLAAAARARGHPWRRDGRGVQPSSPRPHGQRRPVPGRADPRPLGDLRRRRLDQPRGRGLRAQPVGPAAGHARPHQRGHHHAGRHAGRGARLHARLVGGRRPGPSTRWAATSRRWPSAGPGSWPWPRSSSPATARRSCPTPAPRADPPGGPAAPLRPRRPGSRTSTASWCRSPARRRSRSAPSRSRSSRSRWACSPLLFAIDLAMDSEYWPAESRPTPGTRLASSPSQTSR